MPLRHSISTIFSPVGVGAGHAGSSNWYVGPTTFTGGNSGLQRCDVVPWKNAGELHQLYGFHQRATIDV